MARNSMNERCMFKRERTFVKFIQPAKVNYSNITAVAWATDKGLVSTVSSQCFEPNLPSLSEKKKRRSRLFWGGEVWVAKR